MVGTYNDLVELMALAAEGKVRLHTRTYPLEAIDAAVADLDAGRLTGRASSCRTPPERPMRSGSPMTSRSGSDVLLEVLAPRASATSSATRAPPSFR